MPIIKLIKSITTMFATYRPKVEHSILFVKTVNILKDENFFGGVEVLMAVLGSQVWENFLFTIPIL